MTVYVVTKHVGRMHEQENICVTTDASLAVNNLYFIRDLEETREAFIEIWENGEKQYVTREDPRIHDR